MACCTANSIEASAGAISDQVEGSILDPVEPLRSGPVRRERLIRPDCLESLHQIPGGHDVHAELANNLNRSSVDARYVGNGVARRILHRDPLHAAQQIFQSRFELFPSGIRTLVARQAVKIVTLDRVHQSPRLSLGWHQVVPTPGRQFRGSREIRQPRGDRIRAVKIVKQPAIEPLRLQRLLDCWNRQRHLLSIQAALLSIRRRKLSYSC